MTINVTMTCSRSFDRELAALAVLLWSTVFSLCAITYSFHHAANGMRIG